jgi:hypothetical protein
MTKNSFFLERRFVCRLTENIEIIESGASCGVRRDTS